MTTAAREWRGVRLNRVNRPDGGSETADRRFAEWLAEARARRRVTYEALAERVGIHPTYAQKLERGVRPAPRRDVIEALARALTPEGASDDAARALLNAGLLAAGFAPVPDPNLPPGLPDRVSDLPPALQDALRVILEMRAEVRDYMIKLWLEQARPHLEIQAELERARHQARREIEALAAKGKPGG